MTATNGRLVRSKCRNTGQPCCWRSGPIRLVWSKNCLCPSRSSPVPMLPYKQSVKSGLSIFSPCLSSMRPQTPCLVSGSCVSCWHGVTCSSRLIACSGLRYYAEACGENRALWQDRFDAINALAATTPPPPIKALSIGSENTASLEARYRNLFPLSLPRSMFQGASSAAGSTASSPSTQSVHNLAIDEAALADSHTMRSAYIEHTTRRSSNTPLRTPRLKRFQQ